MFVTKVEYRKLATELVTLKRRVSELEKRNASLGKRRKTVSEMTVAKKKDDYSSVQMLDEWLNGEEKSDE